MKVLEGMYLLSNDLENWRKVYEGKHCAFFTHTGEDPCLLHNNAVKSCEEL
jgi:hypothetical protein